MKIGSGCMAWVPERAYSPPGPCQIRRDVRMVRWAPTPMTTLVRRMCVIHRKMLEQGRAVDFQRRKL